MPKAQQKALSMPRKKSKAQTPSKLSQLPSLPELEVCPELIFKTPLCPSWAKGLAFHRSPDWLRGGEEVAADFDRLDLADVIFRLPNAPEDRPTRMSFWQFVYVATLSAGGFSPIIKLTDGKAYVHIQAHQASPLRKHKEPLRYDSTLARVLESAKRAEVIRHETPDRLDLRPHLIRLVAGPGREDTALTVLRHLRVHLEALEDPGRHDYMQLLAALQVRLEAGSRAYRRARLLAESVKGGPVSENPLVNLEARI